MKCEKWVPLKRQTWKTEHNVHVTFRSQYDYASTKMGVENKQSNLIVDLYIHVIVIRVMNHYFIHFHQREKSYHPNYFPPPHLSLQLDTSSHRAQTRSRSLHESIMHYALPSIIYENVGNKFAPMYIHPNANTYVHKYIVNSIIVNQKSEREPSRKRKKKNIISISPHQRIRK